VIKLQRRVVDHFLPVGFGVGFLFCAYADHVGIDVARANAVNAHVGGDLQCHRARHVDDTALRTAIDRYPGHTHQAGVRGNINDVAVGFF